MTLDPAFLARPIAHRGLHGDAPENTLAAFEAAISKGYGIELDIQAAADGTPMVFHDENLMRLAGHDGDIRDLTPDQIAALDINGNPIPTLTQTIKLIDGQAPLLIEIKDQSGDLPNDNSTLPERIAEDLRDYRGPVAVMSFNPHYIAQLAQTAPHLCVGLVTCGFDDRHWPNLTPSRRRALANLADFDSSGASFVSHDVHDLNNSALRRLADRDIPILCWTVRSPKAEALARQLADNITFEGYLP